MRPYALYFIKDPISVLPLPLAQVIHQTWKIDIQYFKALHLRRWLHLPKRTTFEPHTRNLSSIIKLQFSANCPAIPIIIIQAQISSWKVATEIKAWWSPPPMSPFKMSNQRRHQDSDTQPSQIHALAFTFLITWKRCNASNTRLRPILYFTSIFEKALSQNPFY